MTQDYHTIRPPRQKRMWVRVLPWAAKILHPHPVLALHVLGNDLINDPIFLGLFGNHDVVTLHVLLDAVEGLAGVTNQDVAGDLAHAQDLARLDVDVGGLAGYPPSEGWWISTRACGSENLFPFAPAASSSAAIEAACPMQIVLTSGRINCMVS